MADKQALPEDFPGRKQLEEAGVTTLGEVAAMSDEELDAVDGIGPATAEKIRAALADAGAGGTSDEDATTEDAPAPRESNAGAKIVRDKTGATAVIE